LLLYLIKMQLSILTAQTKRLQKTRKFPRGACPRKERGDPGFCKKFCRKYLINKKKAAIIDEDITSIAKGR
ncbi:MAG: hypothetical protein ACOX0K_11490, partial [Oscillospiraceae bacterium]